MTNTTETKQMIQEFKNVFWFFQKAAKVNKGYIKGNNLHLMNQWKVLMNRKELYYFGAKDDKFYDYIVNWCNHHQIEVWNSGVCLHYIKEGFDFFGVKEDIPEGIKA